MDMPGNHIITFKGMEHLLKTLYSFIAGAFTAFLGYFLPIRDIVHLLIFFFFLDVIIGYWASRKLYGKRFMVSIVWKHTIPRMILSLILIIGAYMWDSTYQQEYVSTYKIIGWFISGLLLYSIAENAYCITRWTMFKKIGKAIKDQVVDKAESKFDNQNN